MGGLVSIATGHAHRDSMVTSASINVIAYMEYVITSQAIASVLQAGKVITVPFLVTKATTAMTVSRNVSATTRDCATQ